MSERLLFELKAIDNATGPIRRVNDELIRTGATVRRMGASMDVGTKNTRKFAMGALQQAGYQIGDFAVQVANGTSKIQAFGQQAPQMLQIFGPIGAIVGAGVAIIAAFGVAMQKSGKEFGNFGSALGVLREPLSAVVSSVMSLQGAFGSTFSFIVDNIDTALIAAALYASFIGIRFVAASIAAAYANGAFALSLAGVTAAFKVLQAVMMRFLPLAVILGAAKLIEIFMRLVKGAGGVGNALNLLKDVASEIFNRIYVYAAISLTKIESSWAGLQSIIYDALQGALQNIYSWGNSAVGVFRGAFDAIKAIWGLLPAAIGDFTIRAANALISGVESMLNAVVARINGLISGLNSALSLLPDWAVGEGGIKMSPVVEIDLPDLTNQFSGAADAVGDTAAKAFKDAMSKTYFDAPELLSNMSDEAKERMAAYQEAARMLSKSLDQPMGSWLALKEAIAAGTEEVTIFGDASVAATDKAGSGVEKLTQQQEAMKSIAEGIRGSFTEAFMSMVDGTKTVLAAFKDMVKQIILKLYEQLVVQQLVNAAMGVVGSIFPALAPALSGELAMGGPVTGGQAYMVGERGPEIIVPSRNASVVPNNQLGGGGVTVVQNINITTGVQQTVRAEIRSLMPQIAESAKAAVFDAQRRSVNGMGYA